MVNAMRALKTVLRISGLVGSMILGAGAQGEAAGGTYDLVQILSDERVRETIQFADIAMIKKLSAMTYQINYGQCALIASISEECTEQPGPPSCELRVKFNPAEVRCKP